ncbi:hypothetical protein [Pseudomonas putida]|uniref:Uncharacterized protein n=1 Tax=Pseudomonas putida TaxID=303 RepID=A0A177SPH2_PSEPU|nr:hypothetical protein [Pseudomonas putida]OAI92887.1 hypothetical protein AYO28_16845 [Pseudomonas putida]
MSHEQVIKQMREALAQLSIEVREGSQHEARNMLLLAAAGAAFILRSGMKRASGLCKVPRSYSAEIMAASSVKSWKSVETYFQIAPPDYEMGKKRNRRHTGAFRRFRGVVAAIL